MAFSSPPPAPQRGDRTTFSSRVDAFLLWLTALIPQMNTFLSSLTTLAAGGANSFAYTFNNSIADANPGPGKFGICAVPQNTASLMVVSTTIGNGGNITPFFQALNAGTSNVKASLRLQRIGDITTYLLFDITSITVASGYIKVAIVPRASPVASPFVMDDTVALFFDPKGDRGDGGNTPTQAEMRAAIGTLPIENGGTAATTAAVARTNLGVPALAAVPLLGARSISYGTQLAGGRTPSMASISSSNNGGNSPLIVTNEGNAEASSVMAFLRENAYSAYIGLDTDNVFKIAIGSSAFAFWHAGNFSPINYALLTGAAFTGNISAPVVTETSDERKKTNWRPLTDEQLDALADLELVGVFDWIDGTGSAVGASAQAIRAIVPWAVHEDADGNLSVAYGGLAFAMAHGALRRARAK